jgi:hypothetical protein
MSLNKLSCICVALIIGISMPIMAQSIESDSTTIENEILKLKLNKDIELVLIDIAKSIEICSFYKKDSIVFFVSWSKQCEDNYLFIRPHYINKLPHFIKEYGFYGYVNLNGFLFLFYGIQNEKFYSSHVEMNPLSYMQYKCSDETDYFVLCEGCSWLKKLDIIGESFVIEAEVCNTKNRCE